MFYVTKSNLSQLEELSDIVLSPHFYWIKTVDLDVTSKREVLKIAPSIFAGSTPAQRSYRYLAYSLGQNRWALVAYDLDFIQSMLKDVKQFIKKVYFAQDLIDILKSRNIQVQDKYVASFEDVVLELNKPLFENSLKLDDLDFDTKGFQAINIKSSDSIFIDTKSFTRLAILAALCIISVSIALFQDLQKKSELQSSYQNIIQTNQLPQTSFERESILSPLRVKDITYKNYKESMEKLQFLQAKYKQALQIVSYENSQISLEFQNLQTSQKEAEEMLRQYFKSIKVENSGKKTTIRLKI